jgi:hypothetical protein
MDHKEREGKANLAPVTEFIRRVFSNMQGSVGPEPGRAVNYSSACERESPGLSTSTDSRPCKYLGC